MKLNQDILLTISIAVDLNVSSSWISSFNLSKHPGEGVHSTMWLTEFYYKGLSGLCLQLSRFNMVLGFDLCQDNTVVTKKKGVPLHTVTPCYNFFCMFSLLTPIQHSLQALCLVSVFWIAFRPSIKCFTTHLFMWLFIFTFDICSGCESQKFAALVVSKQQHLRWLQQKHRGQISSREKTIMFATATIKWLLFYYYSRHLFLYVF